MTRTNFLSKLLAKFRLWQWGVLAALGIGALAWIAPQQLSILLLKSTYVITAVVIGYWADRILFPYARPHDLKKDCWRETSTHTFKEERVESAYRAYSFVMLRRALIVGAVVIAFSLGL